MTQAGTWALRRALAGRGGGKRTCSSRDPAPGPPAQGGRGQRSSTSSCCFSDWGAIRVTRVLSKRPRSQRTPGGRVASPRPVPTGIRPFERTRAFSGPWPPCAENCLFLLLFILLGF